MAQLLTIAFLFIFSQLTHPKIKKRLFQKKEVDNVWAVWFYGHTLSKRAQQLNTPTK